MQRLAGNFLVKRTVQAYDNGNIVELYELPNGQWQFGKGRDATVVTSIDQVANFDTDTKAAVEHWLESRKNQPPAQPVQQGQTPAIAGETVKDQLGRAIALMPDDVAARLLLAITQTLGPVGDSIAQEEQINTHADGFGQDQDFAPPASQAFVLPEGARWADPDNQAAGYLTNTGQLDDKQQPIVHWHPTPAFHRVQERPDPVPVGDVATTGKVEEEMERARKTAGRELVGAGSRRRR